MDVISFSEAATANSRIESFNANPDSTSGIVTVPKVIESGETITIPAGRIAVLPNVQIDGVLNVEGEVFIPSGSTMSQVIPRVTSTDNAIVRFDGATGDVQNSAISITDAGHLNIGEANNNSEISIDSTSVKEYTGISIFNSKYTNGTSYLDAGKSGFLPDSSIFFIHSADNSSNITFHTQDSGNNTDRRVERFRIGSTGDIGIGKISTGNKVAIKQRINSSVGGISIENVTGTTTAVLSVLDTGQLILRNAAIDTLAIVNGNTLHVSPYGALGYGTGSGGTVTQLTSKSTTVTLNKPNGLIILNNAALAANTAVGFELNNSLINANDHVYTEIYDGNGGLGINYNCWIAWVGNGNAVVIIKNVSNSTLSDTISIRFSVIKGAIS